MAIENTKDDRDHERAVDALFRSPRTIGVAEAQKFLRQFDKPGLYSWWTDDTGARDLSSGIEHEVTAGLIYLGQSGAGSDKTIASRILDNHLGGTVRNSTLRLTLCAALMKKLDLVVVDSKKLGSPSEQAISQWMRSHLRFAVFVYPDRAKLEDFETRLLARLDPQFNIRRMPPSPIRRTLTMLRSSIRRGPASADQDGLRTTLPEPVVDDGTSISNRISRQPNQTTRGREIPLADILTDYGIVNPKEKRTIGKRVRQKFRAERNTHFADHKHYDRWVFIEGSDQHLEALNIVEGVIGNRMSHK